MERNTAIHFINFLCKFVRGEEVVKTTGCAMISLRCTTSNGTSFHTSIYYSNFTQLLPCNGASKRTQSPLSLAYKYSCSRSSHTEIEVIA
jgi:hypothetical protein